MKVYLVKSWCLILQIDHDVEWTLPLDFIRRSGGREGCYSIILGRGGRPLTGYLTIIACLSSLLITILSTTLSHHPRATPRIAPPTHSLYPSPTDSKHSFKYRLGSSPLSFLSSLSLWAFPCCSIPWTVVLALSWSHPSVKCCPVSGLRVWVLYLVFRSVPSWGFRCCWWRCGTFFTFFGGDSCTVRPA